LFRPEPTPSRSVDPDFGTRLGHADDDAAAPALVRAFERLAHHLGVADALEAVVGAAVGQLHDGIDDVFGGLRVDEVCHAELAGHGFALGVQVDADDLVGAHHLGALDRVSMLSIAAGAFARSSPS
jgi:hypothetical protein